MSESHEGVGGGGRSLYDTELSHDAALNDRIISVEPHVFVYESIITLENSTE